MSGRSGADIDGTREPELYEPSDHAIKCAVTGLHHTPQRVMSTRTAPPARATLQELADWQDFDLYEGMPPPDTVFRLVTVPLARLAHRDYLTVQVFWDDPPGYYLAMRDAYRAGLLPPMVMTDEEIIDGHHRIVLALADKSPTIDAYLPEDQGADLLPEPDSATSRRLPR